MNRHARRFVWTYLAAAVLANLASYALTIYVWSAP